MAAYKIVDTDRDQYSVIRYEFSNKYMPVSEVVAVTRTLEAAQAAMRLLSGAVQVSTGTNK